MEIKTLAGIFTGKFINSAIKEFRLGSGSTWPGHFALKINKNFIKDITKKSGLKVVLIAGTNGKTTTAKLLRHILELNGIRVFQNDEGANLENGLATSLLKNSSVFGKFSYDVAIFEVDENNLPKALLQLTPDAIIFLNLFRDQLDRYGEINSIASKWQDALKKLPKKTTVVLNADDPEIRYLVKNVAGKIYYFSVPESYFLKKEASHDTDSTHCPECGTELTFSKLTYSHLGKYTCKKCGFTNENIKNIIEDKYPSVLSGTYNIYNLQAAIKTAQEVFSVSTPDIIKSLKSFTPAFGRQEKIEYKKRQFVMLLSKNPAGFNQSISVVNDNADKPSVLIALNDRIPDGRDVSWIWDVDFEILTNKAKSIVVTGDRVYDMALRLKYSFEDKDSQFTDKVTTHENSKDAVSELIKKTKEGETAFILPTYSAMLELRKILTGKEIL